MGLDHSDRWVDCDAATRVSNASYYLAVIASSAVLDSELSGQTHRWCNVVSFPLPLAEHQTTTLRTLTCCRKEPNLCASRVCLFLLSVLLCFFLAIGERLEEVCLRGRQRIRPHGHGLDVFLERFGLCESVFDGAVEDRLGFCGLLTFFLLVKKGLASS